MYIYLALIPVIIFGSFIATKKDKFSYLLPIIILLSIVAGFRAETVGIDTIAYISKLECIANGKPELAYGLESGFKLFAKLILKINNSSSFFFTVVALLTNLFIIRRFWDFRYKASILSMVLCYYTCFWGFTLNITRQFLAISIIFYFSKLLEKKEYVKFSMVVIICTIFFHKSSIICLSFIGADLLLWSKLSNKQRRVIGLGIMAIPIVFGYAIKYLFAKYVKYFDVLSFNIGFMVLFKIVFFVFSLIVSRKVLLPINSSNDNYQEYRMRITPIVYYPIGLLLSVIGYFFSFMDRIGFYFLIFECIYFGMISKTKLNIKGIIYNHKVAKDNAIIFSIIIVLLIGYNFIMDLLGNGQGIVPYNFV